MTLTKYLIYMALGTALSWGGWLVVINKMNPMEAGVPGFVFFYLTLLFALTGSLSIFGFLVRKFLVKGELAFRQVAVSFRQAILFSALVAGSLFLQSQKLLTWWNVILFILLLTVLEFLFISFKKQPR